MTKSIIIQSTLHHKHNLFIRYHQASMSWHCGMHQYNHTYLCTQGYSSGRCMIFYDILSYSCIYEVPRDHQELEHTWNRLVLSCLPLESSSNWLVVVFEAVVTWKISTPVPYSELGMYVVVLVHQLWEVAVDLPFAPGQKRVHLKCFNVELFLHSKWSHLAKN